MITDKPIGILDTSVYIDLFRGTLSFSKIRNVLDKDVEIYNDAIVLCELKAGVIDSDEMIFIKQLEINQPTVFLTKEDAISASYFILDMNIKKTLSPGKLKTIQNDFFIALSCKRHGATLVTRNRKDFEKISKYVEFEWVGI